MRNKRPLLDLAGIKKKFGETVVLRGVSLEISEGEFVALLGPSGCGKTTLLRIIAGLEMHDEGSIKIAGEPVDTLTAAQRNIAFVFQSYALYPHFTVRQNIALPLVMRETSVWERLPVVGSFMNGYRQRRAEIDRKVEATAQSMAIKHLLERKPSQLSGGQKQRVAAARALVRKPKLLLMDEPLSNLDAKLRLQLRREIVATHRAHGATTVYVTHDQSEAMSMADRIAVVLEGEIKQVGTPSEIYKNPMSLAVAQFVGSPEINIVACQVREGYIEFGQTKIRGTTDLSAGANAQLAIRPEQLELCSPTQCKFEAQVVSKEYEGSELFLIAAMSDGTEITVKLDARYQALEIGEKIALRFADSDILLFDDAGERANWLVTEQSRAASSLETLK